MTFQPGKSGNPNGRPKGIIDKRTELRGLFEPHAKEIIQKLIECAKAGDSTALRLCVERLIPRVKSDESIMFNLPEGRIDNGDNMLEIVNGITQAVASGSISIDEALKFTDFLKRQRWSMSEAERKQQDELRGNEWRKRWEQTESESNENV